jgi:hypothetical protein
VKKKRFTQDGLSARNIPPPLLLAGDIALLLISITLSSYMRVLVAGGEQVAFDPKLPAFAYLCIVALWLPPSLLLGIYRPDLLSDRFLAIAKLATNVMINSALLFGVFILITPVVSRLMFVFYFSLSTLLIFLLRMMLLFFFSTKSDLRLGQTVKRTWEKICRFDALLFAKKGELAFIALISLIVVALNYKAGFNYSPDSVEYITMASRLRYSAEFQFLPYWPPLFPILIGLFSLLVPFPANAAALVVSVSTIGVLLTFGELTRRIFHSALMSLVAVVILAGMGTFLEVSTTIWSEMPFVLFMLLSIVFVLNFKESLKPRDVYLSLVFAGLAALTRYIGSVQLVLVTLIVVWSCLQSRRRIPFKPIIFVNLFFIVCLVLFRLGNNAVFGQDWFDVWMGPRGSVVSNLPGNLVSAIAILVKDFSFPLIGLLFLSLAALIFKIGQNGSARATGLILLFVPAGYLAALLYSASIYAPVLLDSRLLFPSFPLLVIFALVGGAHVLTEALRSKNEYLRFFLPPFVVALIAWSFFGSLKWEAVHVSDIFRHAGQPTYHFNDGYGLSSTSDAMARIFAKTIHEENVLDVYVLVPLETHGRTFLLQQDIYRYIGFRSISFAYGENQDYSVLSQDANGQEKRINYWFTSVLRDWYTPGLQDPERIAERINQTLTKPSPRFLVVFLTNEDNEAAWDSILGLLSNDYSYTLYDISPYKVGYFSAN